MKNSEDQDLLEGHRYPNDGIPPPPDASQSLQRVILAIFQNATIESN
jgi:hypothetical protein